MSKEVESLDCICCESQFKLVYDLNNTSGFPKFCCFCGEALEDEEDRRKEEELDD